MELSRHELSLKFEQCCLRDRELYCSIVLGFFPHCRQANTADRKQDDGLEV